MPPKDGGEALSGRGAVRGAKTGAGAIVRRMLDTLPSAVCRLPSAVLVRVFVRVRVRALIS